MSSILDAIGSEVSRMMSQTGGQISRLADKVDADREVIAQVEQDARESGIGLNLSREELLESLAEINQELAQSLTVVSSVTDILCSEKIGSLTPAQKDVLEVASSGVAKINKLVSYLGNISGVPEQLTPDRALLDEAYGNS
jgi:signal transduction histidine kinase